MFRVVDASPTSFAAGRRERKRCVVTVPNALNYLVSFVEIGEVPLGVEVPMRNPTTGIAYCCACAESSQAAAEPTIALMKSLRRPQPFP